MNYTIDDMYKKVNLHCWDCKKDVLATVIPIIDNMKVVTGNRDELSGKFDVEISVPVAHECPLCKGTNVHGVQLTVVIDEDGIHQP